MSRRLTSMALACLSLLAVNGTAYASDSGPGNAQPLTFAVIGDVPYGAAQIEAFPRWIDQINGADPAFTIHVGDIKNGSSRCDTSYFRTISADFDRFVGPLVYSPGDNEWTDCHRVNNGAYVPLERLDVVRELFFPRPGWTLGQHPRHVRSQAGAGSPENVRFSVRGVQVAVVHVVGSNDGLQPWTGLGNTVATPEQVAAEHLRMANAIAAVRDAFGAARDDGRAVAIFLQADMFDPTYLPAWSDISAFQPFVRALVDESSRYDGPVYLFNGDSHQYNVDRPLAAGSAWLATYGVTGSADNLRRITVDGSANNTDWLQVTVNRGSGQDVLAWQRVPYAP